MVPQLKEPIPAVWCACGRSKIGFFWGVPPREASMIRWVTILLWASSLHLLVTAGAGAQGNGAAERSGDGTRPVQITFRNGAGLPVSVFWVDSDGVERGYGTIEPGARLDQQTTSTHLWRCKKR